MNMSPLIKIYTMLTFKTKSMSISYNKLLFDAFRILYMERP